MNIASLAKKSKSLLRKAEDIKILEMIYIGLLGKNGEINLLLKTLGKLPKKQRKDAGKALNPEACNQQVRGAAISGIGQALLEELVYQEGLPINPNFLDYNLPRFLDIPEEIIPILVEEPHPDGPYGAMGVGEASLIPAAPAIANAIQDAIGVRVKDMPVTPEKVFKAIQESQNSAQQNTTLSQ